MPRLTSAGAALALAVSMVTTAALLSLRYLPVPSAAARCLSSAAPTPMVAISDEVLREQLREAAERLQQGRARLIFYHVHKSGGSSLCNAMVKSNASLMGCIDEYKDTVVAHRTNAWCNCNGHRDLQPSPLASLPPAAVESYLLSRRPAAFFNEDGVADWPYFGPLAVHAVIVRHPVTRYVSHMLHVLTKDDNRSMDSIDVSREVLRHSRRVPGDDGGIADNYLTRYAAGWSVLGRPRKAGVWGVGALPRLTFRHFEAALRNLEQMQVVLVLEEVEGASQLLQALGLPPFTAETRAGTKFSSEGFVEQLSAKARRHLERQHEWDLLLYAWCLQRHRRTLEAWQQLTGAGQRGGVGDVRPHAPPLPKASANHATS